MSQAQDPDAVVQRGDEQFANPSMPPGMYLDQESGLVLPEGTRPAGKGQVARAYVLAVLLFAVTLGAGYLAWSAVTWRDGQTPAQRLLGLRCWQVEFGRVANREQMALRQITGLAMNGQLLIGVFILLSSMRENSVGDILAGTVVLHDPGQRPARPASVNNPDPGHIVAYTDGGGPSGV